MDQHKQSPAFHHLLHRHRSRLGMTQRQLSDLSTVSVRGIRDLEVGRARRPRPATVRLLANALRLQGHRRHDFENAAAGPAAVPPLVEPRNGPPAPMNRLIGRAAETEILTDLLTTHGQRLLTVTGVSGVGKSRLLLDVATVLHADQDWSVIWTSRRSMGEPVPKSPLGDLVNRALSGCSDAVDELVDAVLDRQVLMVVDGHDGVQRLDLTVFGELLRRCPLRWGIVVGPSTPR